MSDYELLHRILVPPTKDHFVFVCEVDLGVDGTCCLSSHWNQPCIRILLQEARERGGIDRDRERDRNKHTKFRKTNQEGEQLKWTT